MHEVGGRLRRRCLATGGVWEGPSSLRLTCAPLPGFSSSAHAALHEASATTEPTETEASPTSRSASGLLSHTQTHTTHTPHARPLPGEPWTPFSPSPPPSEEETLSVRRNGLRMRSWGMDRSAHALCGGEEPNYTSGPGIAWPLSPS